MPQIDFTIFFILSLWIFPVFFSVFYYSLVYFYPILVLWNKILLCLSDLSFLKSFVFVRVKDLVNFKYLTGLLD